MNLIEQACSSCTQDIIEQLIQENAAITRAIQSDDYIEISAELTDRHNKTSLPLADKFIDIMAKNLAHAPEIINYINIATGNRISINAYNALDIKVGYSPVYKLLHRHDEHTIITHYQNILSIRINKLAHFDKSRYRELINTLIDSELFVHKARKTPSQKNIYNSMRQVIIRRFKVTKYEWCFMFNPEISAALGRHLDSIDAKKCGGTYYLHDSKRSRTLIKVYNTDYKADSDRNSGPYRFMQGDRFRFEILYKSRFFTENTDTLGIKEFKLQKDIFHLLHEYNCHHIKIHLLDKFKGTQLRDILESAKVNSKQGFVDMITDSRSTQVEIDERLRKIETQLAELKATQESQDKELQAMKEFIGFDSKSMTDKRKLRSVK